VPALTLAPGEKALRTSAAVTRWTVHPAPGPAEEPGLGSLRWRLSLLRCRGGRPGAWTVDLRDGRLDPVADAGTAQAMPLRAAG
jgi:protein ImuA